MLTELSTSLLAPSTSPKDTHPTPISRAHPLDRTVSYILQGGMQHKDSQGNEGRLLPGWVQWMTAGSGVLHSEMPIDELMENGGTMEGFQLWVNLPAKDKMMRPRYQDVPPEKIPKAQTEDGRVHVSVIAGESLGMGSNQTRPIAFGRVVLAFFWPVSTGQNVALVFTLCLLSLDVCPANRIYLLLMMRSSPGNLATPCVSLI